MQQLPYHGSCFVCGDENPHSIGITWFLKDNGSIFAEFAFTLAHQGPPGMAHGGASAAVLDEAMGAAVWRAGYTVVAVNLQVNYAAPVRLNEKILVNARITEKHPRKLLTTSEIMLADGTVAVSGSGIYVEAPQFFNNISFRK
jgi:acyl-coenzyme A thioesterase PaaI-like protein